MVDVEWFVAYGGKCLQVCTTSHTIKNSHRNEWQGGYKYQRCCDLPNL